LKERGEKMTKYEFLDNRLHLMEMKIFNGEDVNFWMLEAQALREEIMAMDIFEGAQECQHVK
jgi:hypothetical protein